MASETENLPALPDTAGDLEGWDADDIKKVLLSAVPYLRRFRLGAGLLLWKLRTQMPDGEYGRWVVGYAAEIGVAVRTLQEWRTKAEQALSLPPPSERTVAQRERRLAQPVRKSIIEGSGREADDTLPAEMIKLPADDDGLSSEVEAGTSPRADGSASPRGAQPPAPNLIEAAFGDKRQQVIDAFKTYYKAEGYLAAGELLGKLFDALAEKDGQARGLVVMTEQLHARMRRKMRDQAEIRSMMRGAK